MWRISKKFILSSQKGFLSEESNFLCVCLVRLKVERGLILIPQRIHRFFCVTNFGEQILSPLQFCLFVCITSAY
jgi:hypothetical protein